MPRNWAEARGKVDDEGRCRACGTGPPLQAAHIIPRSRIGPKGGAEHPDNIVPLCAACHASQHAGRLELLPMLSLAEQSYAVGLVGMSEAVRRVTNQRMAA